MPVYGQFIFQYKIHWFWFDSFCVTEADLEFKILLPQSPKYWNFQTISTLKNPLLRNSSDLLDTLPWYGKSPYYLPRIQPFFFSIIIGPQFLTGYIAA